MHSVRMLHKNNLFADKKNIFVQDIVIISFFCTFAPRISLSCSLTGKQMIDRKKQLK